MDLIYLPDLAATDQGAVHVVIRDLAGFHLRDGDASLPSNVRIIDLRPTAPNSIPASSSVIWSRMRWA